MEPNKELPKEVVDDIKKAVGEKYWDVNEMAKAIMFSDGARIAQSHYAPIIEAKDKQIERLKAEKAELHKMVSEKDATISKLMGLLKEEYKMKWYWIVRAQEDEFTVPRTDEKINIEAEELFKAYCKENGIDLGGE